MPRKAKKKKGGWPIRQPKRPAPPPSSSEEDDEEMVLIRGLINRMEVLKKAKAVPSDKGAGPSGVVVPTKVPCHTCGTARTQLVKSLSNRMEVPEKGGGPAGPVSPTEPVDPGMLMPGGPVPVLPSPGVPLPPLPVDPVPVLPSSVVPLPPLPVDQSALNSAVPLAPGSSWIRYDESFRMWAALDPTLPWDMPLQEFWLVIMSPARPVEGGQSDSGHLLSRPHGVSPATATGQQWVQPHMVCWEHNNGGWCLRESCRFKHACGLCGAKHLSSTCPRARVGSPGPKFRPGSNKKGGPPPPPAGKGTQPHQA
ncbi:uncharacterized protein LOC128342232 isoform X2 [Hemicordylus capensis]|uniref:uncharacterized protein LOC128342232 isoform X2 n=1 Tax=Hemicordylus capensis TaxID=884348 RepID=UPI00230271C4|nr:uncharacterized protein LOC128342232 isoform X2 [Hemicordylus capensis]